MKENFTVKRIVNQYEYAEWLLKKHYAHRMPSISYAFGLYENNILKGVCTFGSTANSNLNEIVEGYKTYELNRLVVDCDEKNITSWFVGQCLKMIIPPAIIISYADSGQNHSGYIYQATNWIYTGQGKGDVEFIKDGKQYHRKMIYDKLGTGSATNAEKHGYTAVQVLPKHRYFYIIAEKKEKKIMIKLLLEKFKKQPYPKGTNKRYDASYQPISQQILF